MMADMKKSVDPIDAPRRTPEPRRRRDHQNVQGGREWDEARAAHLRSGSLGHPAPRGMKGEEWQIEQREKA